MPNATRDRITCGRCGEAFLRPSAIGRPPRICARCRTGVPTEAPVPIRIEIEPLATRPAAAVLDATNPTLLVQSLGLDFCCANAVYQLLDVATATDHEERLAAIANAQAYLETAHTYYTRALAEGSADAA